MADHAGPAAPAPSPYERPLYRWYVTALLTVVFCVYSIDRGFYVKGVTSISAAVLDAHGTPLMAISTVGFSAQFNERQITALATDVRDRAQRITRAISGGAPRTAQ